MNSDRISAARDTRISRRSLLRRTVGATAGLAATGAVTLGAAEPTQDAAVPPDHDAATGEIFDRERHHRWDTV